MLSCPAHSLFFKSLRDIPSLTRKVKVLANSGLRDRFIVAKSVIIVVVVRVVKLAAVTLVGLLEVDAMKGQRRIESLDITYAASAGSSSSSPANASDGAEKPGAAE
jgi:hypothetical protein